MQVGSPRGQQSHSARMQEDEGGCEEVKFPNDLPDQAIIGQQGFIKYWFCLLVQTPSLFQWQKRGSSAKNGNPESKSDHHTRVSAILFA